MLDKLIPLKRSNSLGIFISVILFTIQLIYFYFQNYDGGMELSWLTQMLGIKHKYDPVTILGINFNHATTIIDLVHVLFHAGISVLIVWQLYRDKFNTLFVIYLTVAVLSFWLVLHILGHYTQWEVVQLMAFRIRYFIASPLKTIFSVPALKVRDQDKSTVNDGKVKFKENTVDI